VVALATRTIAEYAAGMIDEAQRFFDVSLTVAGFRVILADQTAKRCPYLFIGGAGLDPQRFVERGLHVIGRKVLIMPPILRDDLSPRHFEGSKNRAAASACRPSPSTDR